MKLDPRTLVAPLAALAILALVVVETRDALNLSGVWRQVRGRHVRVEADPYASLDVMLGTPVSARPAVARDPFYPPAAPAVAVAHSTRPVKPRTPAPPPLPVLTSIIFDADPRATVRWDGRDYSVRAGALFADFRVMSITKDQVVLDRSGEPLVLQLPKRGEK